jgi:hypothetical protein
MELFENEIPKKRVVINIVSTKNIYSIPIPVDWNVKRLKAFIKIAFRDQVNEGITLFHEGKKLSDEFKLNTIMPDDDTFPKIRVLNSNITGGDKEVLDAKRLNEIVNLY